MEMYKTSSHSKYALQYHFIWCPKFRFSVLKNDVDSALKNILSVICQTYEYEIIEMEVMPDHVHLFLSLRPTVAPSDVIRTLKSISAIHLFRQYPSLKKFYGRAGSLWNAGYFVTTVGQATTETIQRYIQEQKSKS